jgi:membrane-bound serine protease (ClpP class)
MTLAVALLIVAVGLVMMELAIPSFGLLSLGAATAYAFALVIAFDHGVTTGWTFVGLGVLLLPLAIAFGLKILPLTPIGRRLFLHAPLPDAVQHGTVPTEFKSLLGLEGEALTDLRPAGTARVSGHKVDVVASGRFISRGGRILVTDVNGTRVVVQEARPAP